MGRRCDENFALILGTFVSIFVITLVCLIVFLSYYFKSASTTREEEENRKIGMAWLWSAIGFIATLIVFGGVWAFACGK